MSIDSGYMSPEYATKGLISTKSDVFSFGVLILEILSGKKNTSFYNTGLLNLLGYVSYFVSFSYSHAKSFQSLITSILLFRNVIGLGALEL